MTSNRRRFIQAGLAGAAVAATGLSACAESESVAATEPQTDAKPESSGPLNILILGGTGFIGPHMVREALRRGHNVTLFNRGRTNNALFPDLETIKGDRDNGLDGLVGRQWDAVIDNSGYIPRHVQDSAKLLANNCDRYLYISTVAVYADFTIMNDESSPMATIDDETIEEVNGETYGPLKALCEKRVIGEIADEKLTIVRPTYIAGPGDHTDRFSWWGIRSQRGGEMLWPGSPEDVIQIIDVRDLANFTIDCLDKSMSGTFNAVNRPGSYSMGDLLEDCSAVTAADIDPVWVSQEFLEAAELQPGGRATPIWQGAGRRAGFTAQASLDAGMHLRPERETMRDLLVWWNSQSDERKAGLRTGLPPEREAELIAEWKATQA